MKKDTKLILIVLAGILAIVLLCIFAVQGTQNKAFTLPTVSCNMISTRPKL